VQGLTQSLLILVSAGDGPAPDADAIVKAIEDNCGKRVTFIHVRTDFVSQEAFTQIEMPSLQPIHSPSPHHRSQHASSQNIARLYLGNVAVEHDEIR